MSTGFNHLVASLEARFDYVSARVVARDAIAGAELKEAAKYSDEELQTLADQVLALVGGDDRVWRALGVAPAGVTLPAEEPAAPAPAKEEKAEAPAKEEKAEAPAKEEKAKAPAKEEKAKAPAKEEKAEAPAKADKPKAKADEKKKPAKKKK